MRPLNKILYSLFVTGAIAGAIVAPAQAAPVDPEVAMQAIQEAGMSTGKVHLFVSNEGVVSLTGMVADGATGNRMVKTVRNVPGVTKVVDLLRTKPD